MKATFRDYYHLTKPGIVYGNVVTTIAAFLFAMRWHFNGLASLGLFIATVLGISLVIASGCVCNNYLDREMDAKMERTRKRALVTGLISGRAALIYAAILGIIGLVLLEVFVNVLTAGVALFGLFVYVVLYAFAKRGSSWGAVVGSIAGAVPIVVGYTAVMNQIDDVTLILFLVLVVWQMPHFYAIAMYRLDEYVAAGIPVLPAVKGMRAAKLQIISYIVAYLVIVSSLFLVGAAGLTYFIVMLLISLAWLIYALRGLRLKTPEADVKWAKRVFLGSLIVLMSFSVMIAVAPLLP
ncbi:MAG: heme o synthase [Candidatus Pacebacteria bacterium]|nr:heme o synthase [Candidatus Paceibacterota bacterium]